MKLEIVSHCWRYPRLLNYQLSSLVLWPPQHTAVNMIVYHTAADDVLIPYIEWWSQLKLATSVTFTFRAIERTHLMRRAIGRNMACRDTESDWLWFTDCDHFFSEGCIDSLAAALARVKEHEPLAFPLITRVSGMRAGDRFIRRVKRPSIIEPTNLDRYHIIRHDRAIGGIQVYRGSVAKKRGYIPDDAKYQRPQETWQRTYEDRVFRLWLPSAGVPVKVPGVYRIRHSKRGRFDVGVTL